MLLFEATSFSGAIVPADPCTPFVAATTDNLNKALAAMKGNQTVIKNVSGGSCGSVQQVLNGNALTSGTVEGPSWSGWWGLLSGVV
ncbi:hypothetical protein HK097_007905, partial [Rhizophlyctis rosea]